MKILVTANSKHLQFCIQSKFKQPYFFAVEEVPHGSGPMAFALAKAGVTPEMFPEVGES